MFKLLLIQLGLMKKPGSEAIKILIIEDNPVDSKMIKRTLDICGYRSIAAYNGIEGLNLARSYKPDLVILDFYLPDITGGVVLTALRASRETASTKVLMLTVSHDPDVICDSFEHEVDQYFEKPISMTLLAKKIEEMLMDPVGV